LTTTADSMTAIPATADSPAPAPAVPREDSARLPPFRAVYDGYFDFVWTWVRRFGIPLDAVDDVVQEVFIIVHARLKTVERPASLRSWLYGVTRRTVSMYLRGRIGRTGKREIPEPAIEDTPHPMQPTALDLAVLSDELQVLWRILGQMDPLRREVLVLADIEEMTAPEIAEGVGIPLNTVYSRLRVARQEFNEVVARERARAQSRR
jgi:RNA polymerase sigma-70 factor (ECF subfamily)